MGSQVTPIMWVPQTILENTPLEELAREVSELEDSPPEPPPLSFDEKRMLVWMRRTAGKNTNDGILKTLKKIPEADVSLNKLHIFTVKHFDRIFLGLTIAEINDFSSKMLQKIAVALDAVDCAQRCPKVATPIQFVFDILKFNIQKKGLSEDLEKPETPYAELEELLNALTELQYITP